MGRLLAFVAGMFVVSLTSGNYAFSVFSGALKHTLDLSQEDLDSIGVYPYLAGLFTWTGGVLNDRCGARTACIVGSLAMAASLVAYWAVATRRIPLGLAGVEIALVAAYSGVTLAGGAITAGVFCSINANFPTERGLAVGIAKAWVGLSGGILTQLYVGFVGKPDDRRSTLNFVLLMAAMALFAGAVPSAFVAVHKQLPRAEPALRGKFAFCFLVVLSMAALVTVSALFGDALPQHDRRWFATAILAVLLSLVIVPAPWPCTGGAKAARPAGAAPLLAGGVTPAGQRLTKDRGALGPAEVLPPLPELTSPQVLASLDCWMLFWGVAWISGGGMLVNVNMNQMCESLPEPASAAVAVSLFSVGNGLGRIVGGSISEAAHQARLCPRTMALFAAECTMLLAHVIFVLELGTYGLYAGVTLSAAAFGSTWPLTVVITSELWGAKNHGSNYMMFDGGTAAFCTLLLAKLVAQTVYQSHIADNPAGADGSGSGSSSALGHTCYGYDCFRATHLIEIGLAASGAAALAVLSVRVSPLYRNRWDHEDLAAQQKHAVQ